MDTLSDNVKLVQIFLACCAYADRGYKKFIPVSLYLLYMELTIAYFAIAALLTPSRAFAMLSIAVSQPFIL